MWSWLTLAYPYTRLVQMAALLLKLPVAEAEDFLTSLLCQWEKAGLLEEQPNG